MLYTIIRHTIRKRSHHLGNMTSNPGDISYNLQVENNGFG